MPSTVGLYSPLGHARIMDDSQSKWLAASSNAILDCALHCQLPNEKVEWNLNDTEQLVSQSFSLWLEYPLELCIVNATPLWLNVARNRVANVTAKDLNILRKKDYEVYS